VAYRASKAAMNMVAACYAKEQARFGVKVLAVHPGTITNIISGLSWFVQSAQHSPAGYLGVICNTQKFLLRFFSSTYALDGLLYLCFYHRLGADGHGQNVRQAHNDRGRFRQRNYTATARSRPGATKGTNIVRCVPFLGVILSTLLFFCVVMTSG